MRRARREIDEVIAQLKAKTAAIATESARAVSTGETGAVRSDARAAIDMVGKRFLEPVEAPATETPPGTRTRAWAIGSWWPGSASKAW